MWGRYQRPIDFTKHRYYFVIVISISLIPAFVGQLKQTGKEIERLLPAVRWEWSCSRLGTSCLGGGGEDSEKKVGNNGTTRRSRPDCCSLCLGCYTNSRGGLANVNRVSTFFSSIRRMFNLIVQHRKLNFDWNLKESNWFLERKPSQNLSHEWLFTFCFSFFFGKCSLTLNKQVLFSKQKTMEGQLNF